MYGSPQNGGLTVLSITSSAVPSAPTIRSCVPSSDNLYLFTYYAPERMPLQMDRQVHLVFGVVEGVRDAFRGKDQPNHLDEGAARKSKQSDV